jgi:hypothetical protein
MKIFDHSGSRSRYRSRLTSPPWRRLINGASANAPAWYAGCSALRNHGVNPSQATDYPTRP